MGVSGGIWGLAGRLLRDARREAQVFDRFEPAVRDLAPEGGYLYPAGAGHYVKMVHNGSSTGSCRPTARASTSCTPPTTT